MLMCLQFDKFLLCPTEKTVQYGEIKLDIRGKDFEVLHLLLRHPKRLVRKNAFLKEVWPDVTVEEANIAVCINNIRRTLGVYFDGTLIETVRGEGYRLLVDVVEVNKEAKQFDIQPEAHSNSAFAQQRKNKENGAQAQHYNTTLNHSRTLTDRLWDATYLVIIALSLILLCIGAYFHLKSPSVIFTVNPFFPGLIFFGMYVVVEIIRGLSNARKTTLNIQQQIEIAKAPLQKIIQELSEKVESEKIRADQADEAYQKLSEDFKHRLGYRASRLEIRINIHSYYGDCHSRWIWTDIKKQRPDAIISRLPGSIHFSTPGCSFKQYPVLTSNYDREYQIDIVTRDTKSCEFYVSPIKTIDNMSYEYIADIDKAFCMAEEELAEQPHEYEWFGYHVVSAIETLVINVSFPDYYKPTHIQPDVHRGFFRSEFSDYAEVERIYIENGFSIGNSGEISLTVNRPKIGHHYYVRWKPLPMLLVESMRQRQSH